ncbi:UNVERIFIED_CONTAM: hypothetical protein K2H54_016974 [Gekko kuhli]
MRPQFCVNSDIADWLASIHLERYLDTFKQLGYRSVRDVISLGKEDLQKLGITATGHRKRILSLVQQTQLLVGDKNPHMAGDVRYKSSKCADSLEGPKARNGIGRSKDVSAGTVSGLEIDRDHPAGRSRPLSPGRDLAALVAKPVPKPRTVFPRARQGAVLEQDSAPLPCASLPVSQATSISEHALATCVVLEGFDPGESTAGAEGPKAGRRGQIPEVLLRGENTEPAPRPSAPLNERSHQAKCVSDAPFSSAVTCFPDASRPAGSHPAEPVPAAATVLREPLVVVQAALTRAACPQGRTEMVPGGPWERDGLPPSPAENTGAKEPLGSLPSPLSTDPAVPNGTLNEQQASSLEQPCLGLRPVPEVLVTQSDPAEELISPYCEGMFGHTWSFQEQVLSWDRPLY